MSIPYKYNKKRAMGLLFLYAKAKIEETRMMIFDLKKYLYYYTTFKISLQLVYDLSKTKVYVVVNIKLYYFCIIV